MKKIFPAMILLSVIIGIITGRIGDVTNAVIEGADKGIQLVIGLAGGICFWSGIMNVAKKSGLTKSIAKLLSPILCKLFHGIKKEDKALEHISMNITSNMMGLGNAATPSGIQAMKALNRNNPNPKRSTDNMILFVVINTAAIQIIPTTVATLRMTHGSQNPFEIIPATLLTSIAGLCGAIIMAKILSRRKGNED